MPHDHDHPDAMNQLPDPGARRGVLNEAMLCDLIEGQLPEAKAESARGILARDPVLADTIAQIEHDKAVLQSLGDEMCPADLFSRLEPVLEREILLEAEAHSTGTTNLRSSPGVVVRKQRTWRVPAAVFAAAAALLVVSGVIMVAQQIVARMPVNSPRVANNNQPTPQPAPDQPALAAAITPTDDGVAVAVEPTEELPLIDRPQDAIRLARAGQAQIRVAGMNVADAKAALRSIDQPAAPWKFEGLGSDGPIFCMVEPRSEAWSALTFALREAGLPVSLEAMDVEPAPLEVERVLWWEHRATWAVKPARVPIAIGD